MQFLNNINVLIEAPVFNLALLVEGLLIGAVFALAAYGLALVWGVMNVKNLAQGDFVIMGGYIAWLLGEIGIHPLFGVPAAFIFMWFFGGGFYETPVHIAARSVLSVGLNLPLNGLPPVIARTLQWSIGVVLCTGLLLALSYVILLGVNLFMTVVLGQVLVTDVYVICGLALLLALMFFGGIYNLIIRRVIDQDLFTSLLATFGLALVISQLLNILFSSDTQTADAGFESWFFFGGLVSIAQVKLIAFVLAALLAAGVITFMKNSRMGQAIRATAQDPRAARVLGIDTDKVYCFTFSLNAAICGAAGALISMIWVIQPFYGITFSIRSFVIVTAAGFGNLPGVIAAGLGMGVIEQFGGFILGATFQQALVVGLLVLVLVIRQIQQARHRQVVQ